MNQKKSPHPGIAGPVKYCVDEPDHRNCDDENRNRDNLVHVGRSAAHQVSRDHYQVAGDVGSE
jgi:hypothetical protein